jgi:hypothetical protein
MVIRSARGMLLWVFGAGTAILLALGGQAIHQAWIARAPIALTCSEFVRHRPPTSWVRLSDCQFQWPRTIYRARGGSLTRLYVPASADAAKQAPAPVVFAIDDQESLELAEYVLAAKQSTVQVPLRLAKLAQRFTSRPVIGVVQSDNDEETDLRAQVGQAHVKLASKVAIVEVDARPSVLESLSSPSAIRYLATALVCLTCFVVTLIRQPSQWPRRPLAASAGPRTLPSPAHPPVTIDVTVLLDTSRTLQLVPGRGFDRSLGRPRDVRQRIVEILPSVGFDSTGVVGTFNRTNYSMTFDVGQEDSVRAVSVTVAGGVGAAAPLQRLIEKTGWRLIAVEESSQLVAS